MNMSDKNTVTLKYTGLGPSVHKRVDVSELGSEEYGDQWQVVDDDVHIVKEQDENQEIAEAASAAFRERASDIHGSDAWEGIAEELEADYNLSGDDEPKSQLALRDDESWSEYRERLKSIQVDRDPQEEKESEVEGLRLAKRDPHRSSALADMFQDRADKMLGSDSHPGEETAEMSEPDPEKKRKAAQAFRAYSEDGGMSVWSDLADDLEAEELGSQSVDSTHIETHDNGNTRVVKNSDNSLEIRTSDETIIEECREKTDKTNLYISEDPPDKNHLTVKSPDREALREQVQNL
jgi:hypothetical protein